MVTGLGTMSVPFVTSQSTGFPGPLYEMEGRIQRLFRFPCISHFGRTNCTRSRCSPALFRRSVFTFSGSCNQSAEITMRGGRLGTSGTDRVTDALRLVNKRMKNQPGCRPRVIANVISGLVDETPSVATWFPPPPSPPPSPGVVRAFPLF